MQPCLITCPLYVHCAFKGFSFGALLAISVLANIWKQSYISEDILRRHVVCIAFGAPLINLPPVNQVLLEIPKMESAIHLVFLKDDLIPRLLRFTNLDLNWSTPVPQSSFLPLPTGSTVKVCASFHCLCNGKIVISDVYRCFRALSLLCVWRHWQNYRTSILKLRCIVKGTTQSFCASHSCFNTSTLCRLLQ